MKACFKNITIIGTSHIAPQSIKQVETTIKKQKPKIVAIELDRTRFYALMSNKKRRITLKDIRKIGIKGLIFNLIGAFIEYKLGKIVNTPPGSEMKKAIEAAKETKSQIALIDQNINITLKNISKKITWKEKFRFAGEIIKATFSKKSYLKFDLKKVPPESIIENLTNELKKKYPSIYECLITDRDIYMSKNLNKIRTKYPKGNIVAVVGAGHIKGMLKHLRK